MSFKNYRLFKDTKLKLDKRVTVLVGPNDSGKTTILEFLRRSCRIQSAQLTQDDRSGFGVEPPQISLVFRLGEARAKEISSKLQLKTTQSPKVLEVQIALDGIRLGVDGEVVSDGKQLTAVQMTDLEALFPSPILLDSGLRPMPDAFDLDTRQPDPVLLTEILAIASIRESEYEDLRRNRLSIRSKLMEGSKRITDLLRRFWSQSPSLAVDFRVHRDNLECQIGEPTTSGELWVPATGRGIGLRWFLTFMVKLYRYFEAIPALPLFLFDEPATNLHPAAQRDVYRILNTFAASGQVVYATHSPFMLDWSQPDQIRVLERSGVQPGPVTILNTPYHGEASLGLWEPLRTNLGLFLGDFGLLDEKNLIVEGPSDQLLVTTMARLVDPTLGINPATTPWAIVAFGDGAALHALVDLAHRHSRACHVLLDADETGRQNKARLLREGRCTSVIHVGDILPLGLDSKELSIEDLFDLEWFLAVVNGFYGRFEWFTPIDQSELELADYSLGKALERYFEKRAWRFSKMEIAREIVERIEGEETIYLGFWETLFQRLAKSHGLVWLGWDPESKRAFLHLVDPSAHEVQNLTLEIRDTAGRALATWHAFASSELEAIDTCQWSLMTNPEGLTRYGRIECKISFPISAELRPGAQAVVEILTAEGSPSRTITHSVAISLADAIPEPTAEDPVARFLTEHPIGSVVKGRVVRTGPYGFVVEVAPGVTAFNHISEITSGWVPSVEQFANIGDELDVAVIPYRHARHGFAVSMRRAKEPASTAF